MSSSVLALVEIDYLGADGSRMPRAGWRRRLPELGAPWKCAVRQRVRILPGACRSSLKL